MKTVIKGLKEIKRLNGIKYEDDMPVLDYQTFTVESRENIQEVDFELITRNQITKNSLLMFDLKFLMPEINIYYEGLELVRVLDERINDDVKTIVVDRVIETEEQKFNNCLILEKYCDEFGRFYNKFMEQFEDDKPTQIKIKQWLDNGMSKEEVVRELRKSTMFTDEAIGIGIASFKF